MQFADQIAAAKCNDTQLSEIAKLQQSPAAPNFLCQLQLNYLSALSLASRQGQMAREFNTDNQRQL